MHFGFTLNSSDIDLWNIDLLDEHLDLVDKITPLNILFVSKTFCRHLQDMSSRRLQDMPWRCLQDVFKTSSRRLQRNNFSSSKTSSRCLQDVLREVLKKSSRRLGRCKIVTLKTSWRRLQDMSWRPTNVCWGRTQHSIKTCAYNEWCTRH